MTGSEQSLPLPVVAALGGGRPSMGVLSRITLAVTTTMCTA
jgi:hypothetical protein